MMVSFVHRVIWPFFRPLMKFFAGQVILGQENPAGVSPPLIVVSNHASHFDPFIVSGAMPFEPLRSRIIPIRFFTRDLFFEDPTFRFILRLLGAFPGKIGYGLDEAARESEALLRQGRSVGIFPEWCFPDEPELHRMQLVAPHISRLSGRPVIPAFLFGIDGFTWWKLLRFRKKLVVAYGKPIWPHMAPTLEEHADLVSRGLREAALQCIQYLRREEEQFWKSYAEFYHYLELAEPYSRLKNTIAGLVPERISGRWLDVGTGSGAMVDLLLERADGAKPLAVMATDFDETMLDITRKRFQGDARITVEKLNLANRLPFPPRSFDGITANLVLPYVTHFEGALGRLALRRVLEELFAALKPGGFLLWSTPRKGVNFLIAALASWRSFFDRDHPEYRSYAFHILRHALRIQRWGRREIYHFLSLTDLEQLLHEVGFRGTTFKTSFAGQVHVISCLKPRGTR